MLVDLARGDSALTSITLFGFAVGGAATFTLWRASSDEADKLQVFKRSLIESAANPGPAAHFPASPVSSPSHDLLTQLVLLLIAVAATGLFLTRSILEGRELKKQQDRLDTVTKEASDNPQKPQLAWEAGRATLEKYLNRNLAQVRTIATLTSVVMVCGFGMIMYGLFEAFSDTTKLKVSIVSSASGVLVSFIGGSFLWVYRSLLAQSREYLVVLERINGVGMAVAIIESIPEENAKLKHDTTAELAKTLLTLYGADRSKQILRSKRVKR